MRVAGGQEDERVARKRKETHDVLGQHGQARPKQIAKIMGDQDVHVDHISFGS